MRRRRRELFEDFEVVAVPSSDRSDCPRVRRTIDGKKSVLQRIPKEYEMAEAYRANLPQDQQVAMQKKFQAMGTPGTKKFRPYVHAELVLLDSILSEKRREGVTLRFFAESDYGRYIGCSKPTCRLCKLYIDNHPSGVEFRPGHGNIYHDWRAPDIMPTCQHKLLPISWTVCPRLARWMTRMMWRIRWDGCRLPVTAVTLRLLHRMSTRSLG